MLAGTLLQQFKIISHQTSRRPAIWSYRLQQLHISNLDISGEINETYINMVVIHLLQCLEVHYKTTLTSDSMLTQYLCAHITACYRRLKQSEHISNPLLTDMQQNYRKDFDILKEHIFILEKFSEYCVEQR